MVCIHTNQLISILLWVVRYSYSITHPHRKHIHVKHENKQKNWFLYPISTKNPTCRNTSTQYTNIETANHSEFLPAPFPVSTLRRQMYIFASPLCFLQAKLREPFAHFQENRHCTKYILGGIPINRFQMTFLVSIPLLLTTFKF